MLSDSSNFRQLHCHNSFFFSLHFWHAKIPNNFSLLPYNFDNLVAIIYVFSPIFGNFVAKIHINFFFLILPYNFANLVAIIYIFFSNFWQQKIPINFFFLNSPLQFWQLGCHNFFFPPIFDNLVTTIPFFSLYNFSNLVATIDFFLSSTSLLRALHLSSKNFSNLITKILIFSHSNHHIISLSSLILFVTISVMILPKFVSFLIFSNNFQQFSYHK